MAITALVSVGMIIVMTVAGAFGAGALPALPRLAFWAAIIALNFVKWQCWFLFTIRGPRDWQRSAAIGAIVLNLTLPIEIAACLAMVGVATRIALVDTLASALAISGVIFVIIFALTRAKGKLQRPGPATCPAAAMPPLFARAGVSVEDVRAIVAEDHYCRIHLTGQRSVLVHHRFGDALAQLAMIDGAQLHRGVWVAAGAVKGAVRDGRRWRLVLGDDLTVPISARFVPVARELGWLHPPR